MRFVTLTAFVTPIVGQAETERKKMPQFCYDLCARTDGDGTCFPETDVENVKNCPAGSKYTEGCPCPGASPAYWWHEKDDDDHWCASEPSNSQCYRRGVIGDVDITTTTTVPPPQQKPDGNEGADSTTTVRPPEGSRAEEEGNGVMYVLVIVVLAIALLATIALACYYKAKHGSPRQTAEDAAAAATYSSGFATGKKNKAHPNE
eukprot:GEMP01052650.1.p1 GENE.GEMP01052650.1~~GEMP01052650.1.p1  ORF type:complete len:204 (+),score=48.31 GEMP01052650.1:129-740(+)